MEVPKDTKKSKDQESHPPLPDYMSTPTPSAPAVETKEPHIDEDKWEMVESDLGFHLSGTRTTAERVVESLRVLDEEEKTALRDDLATIEGSRDLLLRLEACIQSERFQTRIWRRIQERDPRNQGKQKKLTADEELELKELVADDEAVEQGFVLVNHANVVDALAEHLVLTYIENYHSNEIEAIRRSKQSTSLFMRILSGLGSVLKHLAQSVVMESLWSLGVSLMTSSAGLAAIAAVNPQMAVAAVTIIWQVLKFAFGFIM
jgi:hypothetical protein